MSAIVYKERLYSYKITEESVDVREYSITSNVKLTEDEIRSIYSESENNGVLPTKGLQRLIDWDDERFTDDQVLNQIKIDGRFIGTDYGDDCQLNIEGDIHEC
jgi:hypothetical protein